MYKKIINLFIFLVIITGLFAESRVKDFKLKNIEGEYIKLSDYQKKGLVIIDFWASWCAPCKKALPKLNELDQKYDNINVLAISVDKPRDQRKARRIIKSKDYKFEVLFDPKQKVMKRFNVKNIPQSFIINPKGEIVYKHTGYQRGDIKHFEAEIHKWMKSMEKEKATPKKEKSSEGDCGTKHE